MLVALNIVPFIVAAMLALILNALLPTPGLAWSWIFGISIASFLTYGYDKGVAGRNMTRVPEFALHLLTLCGGSVGSLLGMQLFRHKTHKKSFRIIFWVIVILQIVAIILVLKRR
jgi:uncharacterized membrane protein YsdA (DUF1294 family)